MRERQAFGHDVSELIFGKNEAKDQQLEPLAVPEEPVKVEEVPVVVEEKLVEKVEEKPVVVVLEPEAKPVAIANDVKTVADLIEEIEFEL
uniref:Uncharacterized protein n=1 Tax=Fagus sylvatica TaxID=28930 RepID=A0A2N9G6V9_FAGSY